MKAKKTGTKHRILWAIDPWDPISAHRKSMVRMLEIWRKSVPSELVPFSVVSPGGLAWPVPFNLQLADQMSKRTKKAVKGLLKKLAVRDVRDPVVVLRPSSSRREMARAAMQFIQKNATNVIAVSTRAHTNRTGARIGGFAEHLIATSKVPVLAISPDAKVGPIRHILFPTDFSRESRRAFNRVVQYAARFGARITLFHVRYPETPAMLYPELGTPLDWDWAKKVEEEKFKANHKSSKRWSEHARGLGVKCEFESIRSTEPLGRAISKYASKSKVDLVALLSTRGPILTGLLGSAPKDVLIHTRLPVLVFR